MRPGWGARNLRYDARKRRSILEVEAKSIAQFCPGEGESRRSYLWTPRFPDSGLRTPGFPGRGSQPRCDLGSLNSDRSLGIWIPGLPDPRLPLEAGSPRFWQKVGAQCVAETRSSGATVDLHSQIPGLGPGSQNPWTPGPAMFLTQDGYVRSIEPTTMLLGPVGPYTD